MPTPDMQHAAPMQEPARIEDREFARPLTLKEKIDFQKLMMAAYAAAIGSSTIPVVERDATLSQEDKIFSHWIHLFGERYSDLVVSDASVRKMILEALASKNIEAVQFVQSLLNMDLPQA